MLILMCAVSRPCIWLPGKLGLGKRAQPCCMAGLLGLEVDMGGWASQVTRQPRKDSTSLHQVTGLKAKPLLKLGDGLLADQCPCSQHLAGPTLSEPNFHIVYRDVPSAQCPHLPHSSLFLSVPGPRSNLAIIKEGAQHASFPCSACHFPLT